MPRPTAVEARDGLRIWARFDDGAEGEADLAYFADKPAREAWTADRSFFESMQLKPQFRTVVWRRDTELIAGSECSCGRTTMTRRVSTSDTAATKQPST